MRRLLLVSGGALVLLVALLALLPTIASTRPVREFVLARVDRELQGSVAVADWSLSWLGPIRLEGVQVVDADAREVVQVDRIETRTGLLAALLSGGELGEIRLASPHVLVHFDDRGPTIGRALAPRAAAGRSQAVDDRGGATDIAARIVVTNGRMTFARDGFEPYEAREVALELDVANLNDLTGATRMTLPDGRSLTADLRLEDLAAGSGIDLARARGTLRLMTDGETDISALASVLTGRAETSGQARVDVSATVEPGAARLAADVRSVNLIGPQSGSRPLNLAVTGTGGLEDEELSADFRLSGNDNEVAAVTARGRADDLTLTFSSDLAVLRRELAQAFELGDLDFGGQAEGTLRLVAAETGGYEAEADIAARDVALRSAARQFTVATLELRHAGRVDPAAGTVRGSGDLVLTGLTTDGRPVEERTQARWSDLSLGDGLRAATLQIEGTALQLAAQDVSVDPAAARLAGGEIELAADLAKAGALYATATGQPRPELAGRLTLSAQASSSGVAQRLAGSGTISDLVVGQGADAVREPRLALEFDAQIDPDATQFTADVRAPGLTGSRLAGRPLNVAATGRGVIEGEQLSADFRLSGNDNEVAAITARGTTADATLTLRSDLTVLRRELAQAFELGDLDFGGQAEGTLRLVAAETGGYEAEADIAARDVALRSAARQFTVATLELRHAGRVDPAAGTVRGSGDLVLTGLTTDGRPVEERTQARWSDLSLGDGLRAATLQIEGTALQLAAQDVSVDPAAARLAGGEIELAADLAKAGALYATATGQPRPELAGRLTLSAQASSSGAAQRLAGSGRISDLVVGQGADAVREPRLDLVFDAQIDPETDVLRLGDTRVTSEKLNLALRGDVNDYSGRAVADLSGEYELSWPAVTAMLHEFVPQTRELVAVSGRSRSPLRMRGPLRGDARPGFRELDAGLSVQWEQLQLLGIPIAATDVGLALSDAELALPSAALPTPRGTVTLAGLLDFKPTDLTLRMPGTTQVLDGVKLTDGLARDLLSRINPVFHQFVDASGRISLTTRDLVLPLGAALTGGGSGGGRLELIDATIRPSGLVQQLVALSGLTGGEPLSVTLRGADFTVRDGRIHYENFTMIFPQDFDVRFYGSVGFDDTLDLSVSLPLRADLLRRLGVTGDLPRYVRALTGARIDLPLSGTRQQPKLDFSQVDTGKLLERVVRSQLETQIEEQGRNLLEELLGRGNAGRGDDRPRETDRPRGARRAKGGAQDDEAAPRKERPGRGKRPAERPKGPAKKTPGRKAP